MLSTAAIWQCHCAVLYGRRSFGKRERGTRVSVNRKSCKHNSEEREKKTPAEREDDYVTDGTRWCFFYSLLKSLCAGYWAIGKEKNRCIYSRFITSRVLHNRRNQMLGIEGGSGVLPTGFWGGIGIPNAGNTTYSELFHNRRKREVTRDYVSSQAPSIRRSCMTSRVNEHCDIFVYILMKKKT